jgi:hypothetical protein
MKPLKPALGFLLRFLVVFVLLMAPWPGWRGTYATGFSTVANLLFARFGNDGIVHFKPAQPDKAHDLEIVLRNRSNNTEYVFEGSARLQGYKPMAFALALTLASPIPWRRRGRAAVWVLLLIHVYVVCRVLIFLLAAFSGDNTLALFWPGAWVRGLLDFLHWLVVISFAGWLILPLPIWILATFHRADWAALANKPHTTQPHDDPP